MPDSNSKKFNILACLKEMNNEERNNEDYLSYTKAWLEKVNRGGLCHVSDDVYLVFKSMEIVTKQILKHLTNQNA